MSVYRARMPALDAVRFTGDNVAAVAELIGADWDGDVHTDTILLELDDGEAAVRAGDYVVQGRDSECHVFPAATFERFYEGLDLDDAGVEPWQDSPDAMLWAKAFEVQFPYSGLDAGTLVDWFGNYALAVEQSLK